MARSLGHLSAGDRGGTHDCDVALLPEPADATGRELRSALTYWAFNTGRRGQEPPTGVAFTLAWAERNSPPLSRLGEPGVVRKVLEAFATRLEGKRASATVVNRKRAVLFNALAYAVELGLLEANPVVGVRRRAPKTSHAVDRRSVVNPEQARLLLDTVKETPRSGPRLVAFFALLYYALCGRKRLSRFGWATLTCRMRAWAGSPSTVWRRMPGRNGPTPGRSGSFAVSVRTPWPPSPTSGSGTEPGTPH
jgi:hypothetical protein